MTYNLIDHDQDPCFRMFRALRIAVYRDAQSLVQALISAVAVARIVRLWIRGFRVEQKDVSAGELRKNVDVLEDVCANPVRCCIEDQVRINIDYGAPLFPRLACTSRHLPGGYV